MGSHKVEDVMIPRVTIRDTADAEIIKRGLLMFARQVQIDYTRKATDPGADQFALTMEMNKRIEEVMQLIRDVGDGTLGSAATDTSEED